MAIVTLFAVELAIIWLLGERPGQLHSGAPSHVRLELPTDPRSQLELAESPGMSDPSKFVLPDPRGFSGLAWLNFELRDYSPPEWDESPAFLAPDPNSLGSTFAKRVTPVTGPPLPVVDWPVTRLAGEDLERDQLSVRSRSTFELEDELQHWRWINAPRLPAWSGRGLLRDSVVWVRLDEQGRVWSAIIDQSSGAEAPDAFALEAATHARFVQRKPKTTASTGKTDGQLPQANHSTIHGAIRFHWHVTPPSPQPTQPPSNSGQAAPELRPR